jgi:3-keto-5-aminohexanoate cleavage enzyme
MAKVLIEVAINGNRPRSDNAHLPINPEEIGEVAASCHAIGASIVHVHSRDPLTTEPTPEAVNPYAESIRAIRARCPVLIWTSCPGGPNPKPTRERFKHLIELAADPETKPDLGIIDMGTLNMTSARNGTVGGHVYMNSVDQLLELCGLMDELKLPRSRLQMFDPNCIRTTLAFVRHGILREPLASTLYFGAGDTLIGMPPTPTSLAAYLEMLRDAKGIWFAAVMGGDCLRFAPTAIAAGGNLRIGLEDYPYRAEGGLSNEDLVRRAAIIIEAMGHEVATVDDARRALEL